MPTHLNPNVYAFQPMNPDEAARVASGGCDCDTTSRDDAFTLTAAATADLTPGPATWEGCIGMEGVMTGDGRLIQTNALTWQCPIPLRYVRQDVGAHDGAVIAGRVLTIERRAGGQLWASGDFDMGSPDGVEARRQVADQLSQGVSMDLDAVSFEVRVSADLLADDREAPAPNADGTVTVGQVAADDEVFVTTAARIRGVTIVQVPAFAEAKIVAADVTEEPTGLGLPRPALVASAAPVEPPRAWFGDPHLDTPTPLTVTADGRVFGHIAVWGTCHIGKGQTVNTCVTPPTSPSNYAYFRTGSVLCDDGSEVGVGHITLDTRHADETLNAIDTMRHYDDTGTAVADVNVGEDASGIWVAGALRPGVSPARVRDLRSSPISGDWRRLGGHLELVAALAVNVPGFPVPRPTGLVASGVPQSLVASGMVPTDTAVAAGGGLDADDLAWVRRHREAERAAEVEKLAADLRVMRAADVAAQIGIRR